MFKKYMNLNGNSGVDCYRIGLNSIAVAFKGSSRIYTYSYKKAGKDNVDNMIKLAIRGYGLNSYINLHCRYLYD